MEGEKIITPRERIEYLESLDKIVNENYPYVEGYPSYYSGSLIIKRGLTEPEVIKILRESIERLQELRRSESAKLESLKKEINRLQSKWWYKLFYIK